MATVKPMSPNAQPSIQPVSFRLTVVPRILLMIIGLSFLSPGGGKAYAESSGAPSAPSAAAATTTTPSPYLEEARRILRESPLIDGHHDFPWRVRQRAGRNLDVLNLAMDTKAIAPILTTDLARLRAGCAGGVFWAAYVPPELPGPEAVQATLEQVDLIHRLTQRHADSLALALAPGDIERIRASGRIASMIGVEGGHSINNSLPVLRMLYEMGARYLTLTHSKTIDWCDSATDVKRHGGLTPFGREVIREMNRMGMLVDLAHVSHDAIRQALDVSEAPVIISHSGAYSICRHERDVPDDILRRIPANGGVVMAPFLPMYISEEVRAWEDEQAAEERRLKIHHDQPVSDEARAALEEWRKAHPRPRATLAQVADHIDAIRRAAGIDHVGIGSDFDGFFTPVVGLEDVSCYPALMAELLRRGYSREDVEKVAGGNLLRVWRKAGEVAQRLKSERPASDARIEALDGLSTPTPSSPAPPAPINPLAAATPAPQGNSQ